MRLRCVNASIRVLWRFTALCRCHRRSVRSHGVHLAARQIGGRRPPRTVKSPKRPAERPRPAPAEPPVPRAARPTRLGPPNRRQALSASGCAVAADSRAREARTQPDLSVLLVLVRPIRGRHLPPSPVPCAHPAQGFQRRTFRPAAPGRVAQRMRARFMDRELCSAAADLVIPVVPHALSRPARDALPPGNQVGSGAVACGPGNRGGYHLLISSRCTFAAPRTPSTSCRGDPTGGARLPAPGKPPARQPEQKRLRRPPRRLMHAAYVAAFSPACRIHVRASWERRRCCRACTSEGATLSIPAREWPGPGLPSQPKRRPPSRQSSPRSGRRPAGHTSGGWPARPTSPPRRSMNPARTGLPSPLRARSKQIRRRRNALCAEPCGRGVGARKIDASPSRKSLASSRRHAPWLFRSPGRYTSCPVPCAVDVYRP
jgi:hypothetical protein